MDSKEDWAQSVVGRQVDVDVTEPGGGGPFRPASMRGRVLRVLRPKAPDGRDWLLVLVRLDMPFRWVDRETRLVSIVSRSSYEDLSAMKAGDSFPVNISAEPDWVQTCPPDDARLPARFAGVDRDRSIWLGFGGATLR